MFEAAFELLEDPSLPEDQTRRLAQIARMHATELDIDARWTASSLATKDTSKWLDVGDLLTALKRVDSKVLAAKMGTGSFGKFIPPLLASGRYDCLMQSEELASLTMSHYLNSDGMHEPNKAGDWPFYLLPIMLEQGALRARIYGSPRGQEIKQAIDRFKAIRDEPQLPTSLTPGLARDCFELSVRALEILERGDLDECVEFLDNCRKLWGAKPLILAAALELADYLERPKRHHFNMADREVPMAWRFRAARAKRNDSEWWKEQFRTVEPSASSVPLSLYLAYFSLATTAVLSELAEVVSSQIDRLTDSQWAFVIQTIGHRIDRAGFTKGSKELFAVPQSPRMALLLGLRSNVLTGRKLFLEKLLDSDDPNYRMAEFRQLMAVESARSKRLDWSTALSIVRQTYGQGAAYFLGRVGTVNIPEEAAEQIFAQPRSYPAHLWDLAEAVATAKARRAVRAVGSVAKAERWFAY